MFMRAYVLFFKYNGFIMNRINEVKNPIVVYWMSLLLLCPAFLFTVVADVPHVMAITFVVLLISCIKSKPLVRNTRNLVYALVLVGVVTVLGDQIVPVEFDRFFVLPSNLYCPFMIYLGLAGTLFPQRRATLCAVVATSIIAVLMTGNVYGFQEANVNLPMFDTLLRNYSMVYAVVVGIQMFAIVCVLPYTQRRLVEESERRTKVNFVVWRGVGILGLALSVFAMQGLTDHYYQSFKSYCDQIFQLRWRGHASKVVFGDEVDLWRRSQVEGDSVVMLRAVADTEPGYLRGREYGEYQNGRWLGSIKSVRLHRKINEGRRSVRFTRGKSDVNRLKKVEIYPSSNFYSDVLLVPPTSRQFDLVADGLTDYSGGMLKPQRWKSRGAYSVYAPVIGRESAFEGPDDDDELERYLQIPGKVEDKLREFSTEVFSNKLANQNSTQTLKQLSTFFTANNYTYELGIRVDQGDDPVMEFLDKRKKGHCELFAASSVLLLRTQGIPARYVTGFVCAEKGGGDYWISRAEHAHAWAEAWLPDEKRWVMVENTPPDGRPTTKSQFSWFSEFLDRVAFGWGKFVSALTRGEIAEAIMAVFGVVFTFVVWFFDTPLKAVIFGLILLVHIYRRFSARIKRMATRRKAKPEFKELASGLKLLESRLKKFGLKRGQGETIREFSLKILTSQLSLDEAGLNKVVREFELLRYQPEQLTVEKIEAWRLLISDFVKTVSK